MIFSLNVLMKEYATSNQMTDNHETASSPKSQVPALLGGLLLGGVLAVMGGFFVYALLAFGYSKAAATHRWVETSCTIQKSVMVTTRATPNSPGLSHELDILFEYSVNGSTYQSTRHRRIATRSAHESKIRSVVDKFPAGSQATCFVDPDDPTMAVLKKDTKAVGYTVWFPGLFVIGGLGIMIAAVRNWFKAPKQARRD
jgi:hypothetical protein